MSKQEFINKVTYVAEVVCGDEYLFGVVEFSDTRKYIAFAAEGATLNTPRRGIHKSEELFGETSAKDMAEKLLAHIDLSKVSRIYETC